MASWPQFKAAPSNSSFHAYHHSGTRSLKNISLVVIHATEGPVGTGAAGKVAHYFTGSGSGGSTQLIVDQNSCYRCLKDTEIPWGAPGANTQGVHIEQCGYTAWTRDEWWKHAKTMDQAAYHAAKWCHHYHIPAKWRTSVGLKLGRKGITSHNAVSKAWHETDHSDPGRGFPRRAFVKRVRWHLNRL